jgi:hypothetical protein
MNPNINTKEYDPKFTRFHDLMQYRVREILLVSTPYDSSSWRRTAASLRKDFSDYLDLNLQFVPRIAHASSANEAFKALKSGLTTRDHDAPDQRHEPAGIQRRVKAAYPEKTGWSC